MKKRTDFIILGVVLLLVAGGLFYYTTIPFERTVETQEYVTKEEVVMRERTVPQERLVRRTREAVTYTDTTLADTTRNFDRDQYIVIADVVLKPKDRIKFDISTDPQRPRIQREFEFIILDDENYNLWRQDRVHTAHYKSPAGATEIAGYWTVPDDAPIRRYRIVLSNRHFAFSKTLTYQVIKQESSITTEEYLERVVEEVTETYEERIPYQELVTVERQERYWHDEYRPISYILGAFGILGIAIGFFTHAQSERYKAKPGKERQKTPIKDPKSLPPCPLCSSRVVPTHIIEDGKRIYKCTQCDHIFDLE